MRRTACAVLLFAVAGGTAEAQMQHAEALVHQEQQGTLLRLREAPLPSLDCKDVLGEGSVRPAEGKFSILLFWGPWCAPCKPALQALGELHRSGKADLHLATAAFVDPTTSFVADARPEYQADIERYRVTAPTCVYENATQQSAWGAEGVPVLILFDKKGRPIRFVSGGPRTEGFVKLVAAGWRPQ